jgi:hypothetical protein
VEGTFSALFLYLVCRRLSITLGTLNLGHFRHYPKTRQRLNHAAQDLVLPPLPVHFNTYVV